MAPPVMRALGGARRPRMYHRNLLFAPADLRKAGAPLDLAIAIGILLGSEQLRAAPGRVALIGERGQGAARVWLCRCGNQTSPHPRHRRPQPIHKGVHHGLVLVPPGPDSLTPRERTVLLLIADGIGLREIAHRLGVQPCTVRHHRDSARGKLGAATTTHAIVLLIMADARAALVVTAP